MASISHLARVLGSVQLAGRGKRRSTLNTVFADNISNMQHASTAARVRILRAVVTARATAAAATAAAAAALTIQESYESCYHAGSLKGCCSMCQVLLLLAACSTCSGV
jgi:hypothetical protein